MSEHFGLYEISYENYDYGNADGEDWFNGSDSREGFFRISPCPFDLMSEMEPDDKGSSIKTGASLFEDHMENKKLIPHHPVEVQPFSVVKKKQESSNGSSTQDMIGVRFKHQRLQGVSVDALCLKSKVERGDRFSTKNICKHLHTETAKFLKNMAIIDCFTPEEVCHMRQFCRSQPSIEIFKTLLKNARMSAMLRNFYESKSFLRELMSSKMQMKAKLTMIKYLQKIRSITYDKNFKAWKRDEKDF